MPVKTLLPPIFCILPDLFITVMGAGVIARITSFVGTGFG